MPDPGTQALVNQWLMIGAGVGSVAALMLASRMVSAGRSLLGWGERPLHGRSMFATRRDGEQSGLRFVQLSEPEILVTPDRHDPSLGCRAAGVDPALVLAQRRYPIEHAAGIEIVFVWHDIIGGTGRRF